MSARRIRALGRAMLLGYARDRTSLLFTLAFPIAFLLIFSALLGDAGSRRAEVFVTGDGPLLRALPEDVVDAEPVPSVADGVRRVRDGDRPALVYEEGGRVVVRYAASDQVGGATVRGIVAAVVADANLEAASNGAPPRYTLATSQVEDEALSAVEFFTPGMLGWAIAISSVFGVSISLVDWRAKGLLRRLRLSPLSTAEIALARIGVSLLLALGQTAAFFAVAVGLLGLDLAGSWWAAIPLVLLGTLAFLPLGLIIGSLARTVESASAIAQLVTLPMAFASGAFFPLDVAPSWLQTFSRIVPLRHLIDGLQDVMVRGRGIAAALPEAAAMLAFTLVLALVAARLVRLDDE